MHSIRFYVETDPARIRPGGNLTLKSSSPWDYPIINPGLLGDQGGFDLYTMREALKAGRRFLQAPAWQDWIVEEVGDGAAPQTDAEIEAFIRKNALVVNHVSGTVAMGKKNTTAKGSGALNPDFTVKGTVGLRVVDASAFVRTFPRGVVMRDLEALTWIVLVLQPFIPSGHTMVPTYALAERAADLIKG